MQFIIGALTFTILALIDNAGRIIGYGLCGTVALAVALPAFA